MISDLGTSIAYTDRLGDQVVHNYVCLDCGYKMTTNVYWDKNKNRDSKPNICPNCGTHCNKNKVEGLK